MAASAEKRRGHLASHCEKIWSGYLFHEPAPNRGTDSGKGFERDGFTPASKAMIEASVADPAQQDEKREPVFAQELLLPVFGASLGDGRRTEQGGISFRRATIITAQRCEKRPGCKVTPRNGASSDFLEGSDAEFRKIVR